MLHAEFLTFYLRNIFEPRNTKEPKELEPLKTENENKTLKVHQCRFENLPICKNNTLIILHS